MTRPAATGRSCLVVAPHPDDETIGCGATIARKRAAGTDTWVLVVTDGRHSHRSAQVRPLQLAALREEESRRACELLGVDPDQVRFGGFEEGTLGRCLDAVADAIGARRRPRPARRGAGLLGRRLERRPPPGPPRHLPGAGGPGLRRPGRRLPGLVLGRRALAQRPLGGARPPAADARHRPGAGAAPPRAVAGVHRGVRGPQAGRLRPLPLPGHEPDRGGRPGRCSPTSGSSRSSAGPSCSSPSTSRPGRSAAARAEVAADAVATDGLRPGAGEPVIETIGRATGRVRRRPAGRRGARHPRHVRRDPSRRRRRGHDRRRQPRAAPGHAGHARLRPPGPHLRSLRAPAGPHAGGPGPQQPQHRAVEHPGRGSQGAPAPPRPRPARGRARRGTAAAQPAAARRQPGRRLLARPRPRRPPGRGQRLRDARRVDRQRRAAGPRRAGDGPPPPGRPERADHVPGLPAGAGRGLLRRLGAGRLRHGHVAGPAPCGHRPRRGRPAGVRRGDPGGPRRGGPRDLQPRLAGRGRDRHRPGDVRTGERSPATGRRRRRCGPATDPPGR